ncbi:MAG: hypothetical protein ACYCYE_08545 [Clostridia bacterium]
MFTNEKYSYLLQQTILMTVLTLCKFTALYYSSVKPQYMLLTTLRTFMLLLAIYSLLNLVLARRSFLTRIILHETLSLIVLSDLLYFKYFNVLPSAVDLQFLKVLPTIWDSIISLFSVIHVLLNADSVLFIFHHYSSRKQGRSSDQKVAHSLIAATLMLIFVITDFSLSNIKSSVQAYERFGLLNGFAVIQQVSEQ